MISYKVILAVLTSTALTAATVLPAQAQMPIMGAVQMAPESRAPIVEIQGPPPRWIEPRGPGPRRHYRPRRHRHHGSSGAGIAAGIAGLGLGLAIGAAAARNNPPPPPAGYGRPAPWTPDWYAYCSSKYRSFDPRSGTYQPYHGPRRLCR